MDILALDLFPENQSPSRREMLAVNYCRHTVVSLEILSTLGFIFNYYGIRALINAFPAWEKDYALVWKHQQPTAISKTVDRELGDFRMMTSCIYL